ncbi:Ammonium transporter MEP3 [Bienertia sinuspersici]
MDLRTIKENLNFPIKTPEYQLGVDGFMSYANRTLTIDAKLSCPCIKCVNNKLLNTDEVNYHLLHNGMMHNYSTWIFHGESMNQVPTPTPIEPMAENETVMGMDMRQMLHDIYGRVDGDPVVGEVHASKHKRRSRPRRFLYPKSLVKWILKSIGHKWRDYKCYLKGRGYDDDITSTTYMIIAQILMFYMINGLALLISGGQRREGKLCKALSKHSKESHSKAIVKPIHTTGTKSHARVREELNQIKKIATEQGENENLDDDPVSQVLGKDQSGRVRGLGLDVKPSDVESLLYPDLALI